MDNQLLQLKQDSYKAAGEYRRAVEHWQTASRSEEAGERLNGICVQYRGIARAYNDALGMMIAYLRQLEPTKLVTEEIGRALKLQELLAREIELIFEM